MAHLDMRSPFIRLVTLALLFGVLTTSFSNISPISTDLDRNSYSDSPQAINPSSLTPPKLVYPQNNTVIFCSTNIPFQWQYVSGAYYYRFEIATDPNFTQIYFVAYKTSQYHYVTISTPRNYYWRVTAYDEYGKNGLWSEVRTLIFDSTPTQAPTPLFPKQYAYLNSHPITFNWSSSGSSYWLQLSNSSSFSSSIDVFPKGNSFSTNLDMSGSLYWRICAKDSDYGYWSDWSSTSICYVDNVAPESTAYLTGQKGENDWYVGNVVFSIGYTDIGYGIKEEKYSFDNDTWYTYAEAFSVDTEGINIIYYFGIDLAGNMERIQNITFYLDKSSPQTYLSITGTLGNDGWYKSSVEITIFINDNIVFFPSLYYSLDNGEWIQYNGPILIVDDGIHIIQFYGKDLAGNTEPVRSNMIKIDRTSPTSKIILNGTYNPSGWYLSPVQVELSSNDAISENTENFYSYDGLEWWNYIEPFLFSTQGIQTIFYYSVDNAGNCESVQISSFKIDRTAPSTNISVDGILGPTGWYQSIVGIGLFAEDAISDIAEIYYSFDGIEWYEFHDLIYFQNEGIFTIHYYAEDKAGNRESSQYYSFKIDLYSPVTSIKLNGILGSNEWFLSNVTIELSSSDLMSGVSMIYYSFDNIKWYEYSSNYSAPIILLEEGLFSLYYYSIDYAGNIETFQMIPIKIDLLNPEMNILVNGLQGMNDWYTGNVNFSFNGSDTASGIAQMWYSFDRTNWSLYQEMIIWCEEGDFLFSYMAIDNAGRISAIKSLSFKIDMTPPISDIAIDESWTDEMNLTHVYTRSNITIEAREFFSGLWKIQYRVNGSEWFKFIRSFSLTDKLGYGKHLIEFKSLDNAGNEEPINELLVSLDPEFVTYYGMIGLLKENNVYFGFGTISIGQFHVVIEICGQYAIWNITNSMQFGKTMIYYAEGDLGPLYIIIKTCHRCNIAIAIGSNVYGIGFLLEERPNVIEFSPIFHHDGSSSFHSEISHIFHPENCHLYEFRIRYDKTISKKN